MALNADTPTNQAGPIREPNTRTPLTDEVEYGAEFSSPMAARKFAREMERKLMGEIAELENWKREALSVMPPMQEIGKALGLPIGVNIHDKILPGIQGLTTCRDHWENSFDDERLNVIRLRGLLRAIHGDECVCDDCLLTNRFNSQPGAPKSLPMDPPK